MGKTKQVVQLVVLFYIKMFVCLKKEKQFMVDYRFLLKSFLCKPV